MPAALSMMHEPPPWRPSPMRETNPLLDAARRNIRQFIAKASFASEADRWSAGQCIDVMEAALADGRGEGVDEPCPFYSGGACTCGNDQHPWIAGVAPEPPTAAPCDHRWATDNFGPTQCTRCGTTTDAGREDAIPNGKLVGW